jgi:hypothetical protein
MLFCCYNRVGCATLRAHQHPTRCAVPGNMSWCTVTDNKTARKLPRAAEYMMYRQAQQHPTSSFDHHGPAPSQSHQVCTHEDIAFSITHSESDLSLTCGHGLFVARVAGGGSINSRLITLVAPWRRLVAMQSVPVSPPPITTTCGTRGQTHM